MSNIVMAVRAFEHAGIPVSTHRRVSDAVFNLFLGDGRQIAVNARESSKIHAAIARVKKAYGRRSA